MPPAQQDHVERGNGDENMKHVMAVLSVLTLVAAACGDSATTTTTADATATTTTLSTTTPATTVAATAPTTTAPTTTTTAPTTTTVEQTTTTAAWIGEPIDFWVPVPEEGPVVGVVGVRYDDVLNVRSGPHITFDVIATLDPTQDGISGTGNGWQLPSGSVWWEIEVGGVVGWANQRFLSRLAGVDDVTSFVVNQLGEIPSAETMLDLGLVVARVLGSQDEEVASTVVVVVAPTVGDLGEIVVDVLGLADDSVAGSRLHIFGQPTESGEGFSLMAVEATTLCQRGISGGVCV
jgi:hypothetical protein